MPRFSEALDDPQGEGRVGTEPASEQLRTLSPATWWHSAELRVLSGSGDLPLRSHPGVLPRPPGLLGHGMNPSPDLALKGPLLLAPVWHQHPPGPVDPHVGLSSPAPSHAHTHQF